MGTVESSIGRVHWFADPVPDGSSRQNQARQHESQIDPRLEEKWGQLVGSDSRENRATSAAGHGAGVATSLRGVS